MKPIVRAAAIIVGLCSGIVAQGPRPESLQQLYEQHRWFDLRDALAGRTVPTLYAGAVASAFGRTSDAERYFNQAVREATTIEEANEAREALINLHMRLGRSSEMVRRLDEALTAAPSRADFRNVRDLFQAFRTVPDQTARIGRGTPFKCEVGRNGVVLPVRVNGKAVEWLFDSAISHSAMSESEARMLGVSVQSASGSAGDFVAGTAPTRAAVVDSMRIGDAELRHVPALVFPDKQPPWNEERPGRKGTIGLPVALAMQAIGWKRDGTCAVGSNSASHETANPNLAFDGVTPLTRVRFAGKTLEFVLDTGNQGGTQLWERFGQDFPQELSKGRKGTKQVHQIGGTTEQEIVAIPEIQLQIGGFASTLRPALVFGRPVGNEFQYGNLGLDVLSQAAEVVIDFRAMFLTVR